MISTRKHLEALRQADRQYWAELRATDRDALKIAKAEVDRHLFSLNDLHAQMERERALMKAEMERDRARFMTTESYMLAHDVIVKQIGGILEWRANITGRMVIFTVIGLILVGTCSALLAHLIGG